MNTTKKPKLIPFKHFKAEIMKDSALRKAYDELDVEFEIIKAIVKKRAQKKLTQKALAEEIGVAQSALARFESGRGNPTLSFIQKITAGLGLRLTVK